MANKEVRILSTGKYIPKMSVSNNDLSKVIDTNDNWIRTRTGIEKRRITVEENTSSLGTKAALDALKKGGISLEDLDLIIVVTITPDYFTPSTACVIQRNIKAYNAFAFDISAACSGFTYGVSIASQFIKGGSVKKALVIGVETLSKLVNWKDRNTCVLFGDGAGSAILTASNEKGIINIQLGSDGRGAELLKCKSSSLTVSINVNAIAPGFIETDMINSISDKARENIISNIPLKRVGKAEDVAELVVFLASDNSSYITGQIINIDGGMVI